MPDEPRDWRSGGEPRRLPPELDPRGPRRDPSAAPAGYRGVPLRGDGPARQAPPRSRRLARALSWVAVATSVAVLGVSGAGYALVNHYDGQIERIDVFGGRDGDRPAEAPRDAVNVLLVGSDSRGDLEAGEGVQGVGEDFVTGQRADTIILAHLYGDSDQAQLVSFPRDSYVEIPSHVDTDSGEVVPASMGKINRSFFLGGAPLLIDTVENLTDIRIDHYVQVDFDGFTGMVDELDGIEVCLPRPARDRVSGIDLDAGRHVLMGRDALAYVRQRNGLARGDIDRIARQQQFMGAMIRKVISSETLLNPARVNGFLTEALDSLKVDDGTDFGDLRDLAFRFRGFSAGGISFATVPVADMDGRRKNADGLFESVVLIDEPAAEQLFRSIRQDVPPGTPEEPGATASPAPRLIVAPEKVRVQVYNGAGITGLGRQAATDLERVGFQVIGAPGNRGEGATGTVVRHGPDRADSAATLAAAVPGAMLELDPALGRNVELVVGSGYTGAREVQVAGAAPKPSAPAAGAPSAAPTPVTAAQDPCAV